MRRALLSLALALSLSQPASAALAVSGVTVQHVDRSSAKILATITDGANHYEHIKWGTATGDYDWNIKSNSCIADLLNCSTATGLTSFQFTGLAHNTTVYFRVCARPNADDASGEVCSSESSFTTLNLSSIQSPAAPTSWVPTQIDTTGYTEWELTCDEMTNYPLIDGADPQTKLNAAAYGTVIEYAPGLECEMPEGGDGFGVGWYIPGKSLDNNCGGECEMDDPDHRYIVVKPSNMGVLVPYGSRETEGAGTLCTRSSFVASQFLDLNSGQTLPIHHWNFIGLVFGICPDVEVSEEEVNPAGIIPAFIRADSTYNDHNNAYLIFDRMVFRCPGAPYRCKQAMTISGNHIAVIGSTFSGFEWWAARAWPTADVTLTTGNTVLDIPQSRYQLSVSEGLVGMAGVATATLSSVTGNGSIRGYIRNDGLYIVRTAGIANVSCPECVLSAEGVLPTAQCTGDVSTDPEAVMLFHASISTAGGGTFTSLTSCPAVYVAYDGFGATDYTREISMGDKADADGGPYYFGNNALLSASTQPFYMDQNFRQWTDKDLVWERNTTARPLNSDPLHPDNDRRYPGTRDLWETKRLAKSSIIGSIFSGGWATANDGPAIRFSARAPYFANTANADGVQDITIRSITAIKSGAGIACYGGSVFQNGDTAFEPRPASRFSLTNIFLADIGNYTHTSASLNAPVFVNAGCQDFVLEHNTVAPSYGYAPFLLQIGSGHQYTNGLRVQNNIFALAKGAGGYGGIPAFWSTMTGSGAHPPTPAVTMYNTGSAPDFVENLDQIAVAITSVVTPTWVWSSNRIFCTYRDTDGTYEEIAEITQEQCAAYAANMPAGDTYISGDTLAERIATLGLNIATGYASNAGGDGINYEQLLDDQGIVRDIEVTGGPESILFTYTAPNTRACVVGVSADEGDTWTNTNDGGGAVSRSLAIGSLTGEMDYVYRVRCYFDQYNDGSIFAFGHWPEDQVTYGEVTTLAAATATTPNVRGKATIVGNTTVNK